MRGTSGNAEFAHSSARTPVWDSVSPGLVIQSGGNKRDLPVVISSRSMGGRDESLELFLRGSAVVLESR